MEIGLRESLMIFGVIVLAVVLIDGVRMMRRRQKELKLRIGKGVDVDQYEEDETCGGELLSAGRVVEVDQSRLESLPLGGESKRDPYGSESRFSHWDDEEEALSASGSGMPPAEDPAPQTTEPAPAQQQEVPTPDVIQLTVHAAPQRVFNGQKILEVLLACGMQHGEMSIFHRYENRSETGGDPLFSVANAIVPGTFDLDQMVDLTTPGISFFMDLRQNPDVISAFEQMLDTARYAARMMGGELRDANRLDLAPEAVEQYRVWVRQAAQNRVSA